MTSFSRYAQLLCFTMCFWLPSSQSQDPEFEEYLKQQQAQKRLYIQNTQREFSHYKRAFRNGLTEYKKSLSKVWGYADVSSETRLIKYSKDLQQKLIVDFDNNTLKLVQNGESSRKDVEKLVTETLLETLSKDSEQTIADTLGLSDRPIAELITALQDDSNHIDNKIIVSEHIKQLEKTKSKLSNMPSEQSADDKKAELEYIKTIDRELQQSKKLLAKADTSEAKSYQIRLPARRWQRAQPYRNFIRQQAAKYKIEQALIYGVMEVESSFNPRAQSPVPAFGLMQIVPTTAGIDTKVFLRRGNQPPTRRELFDPENNVLFGSTYLHILFTKYFHRVKDPQSRAYCAIAAYNIGMGNVAKLFNGNGSYNVKQAVPKINRLSPEQVLKQIVERAHPETQAYIQRVIRSKKYFQTQLASNS